jgi:lipoate-protein ligase A
MIERDSGGGAVPVVGPWLVGASVVLPHSHALVALSVVQSYRWFGEAHARALARLGVHAAPLTPADARSHDTSRSPQLRWACFGSLSPWEVVGREQSRRLRRDVCGRAEQ